MRSTIINPKSQAFSINKKEQHQLLFFIYTVLTKDIFLGLGLGASMNIILIHGMNQQNQTAESLRQRWLRIFKRGLHHCQQDAYYPYLKQHIRMPFYGDLLSRHHLQNTLNASTLMPQHWPHFPFVHTVPLQPSPQAAHEHSPEICSNPQLNVEDALNSNHKIKWMAALTRDLALRDFALIINHFPDLHASLLHKFLVETYLYLSNPHFIQAVHARIHQQLHTAKPQMIIAHSLGSVIAYNFMIQHPELNIQRFITLGSPLAFRVIQSHLPQPIQRPPSLAGDWINFYSADDFLTAFPLSESPFKFKPAIINHEIRTQLEHPHDIGSYLQHPLAVAALLEMLKKTP
jgi:hypothetical protein